MVLSRYVNLCNPTRRSKLKDIADFPGTYGEVRGGATVVKGAGYWYVRNGKGVEMVIKPHAEGLALSLGASGITVKLVDEK